ncbi:MAG: signal peptidase I [Firmicutes bacterium]|nr:signal peptidase I [Bacillota bacterium]
MEQVRQDRLDDVRPEKKQKSIWLELLELIVIAFVLVVIIKGFLIEPFYIPSGSMEPTLQINDRIIVSKLSYHLTHPHRGDIIVFKYPEDHRRDFVKRLIAVGGETVELRNSVLLINGQPVAEDYLPQGLKFDNYPPTKVPYGFYFMLGDNRNNSDDSRYWGMMPQKDIIGKAVFIYWPLNRLETL